MLSAAAFPMVVLPLSAVAPVTVKAPPAATSPVRVEAPVTVSVPAVFILVLMVVAAPTVAVTTRTDNTTANVTETGPRLKILPTKFFKYITKTIK